MATSKLASDLSSGSKKPEPDNSVPSSEIYSWASQQKSQNVASDPIVIFQTVQVHSDSGKCISCYAGGWRTFAQDMELLLGTYTFRFSDRTRNTSYTVVTVKHIHLNEPQTDPLLSFSFPGLGLYSSQVMNSPVLGGPVGRHVEPHLQPDHSIFVTRQRAEFERVGLLCPEFEDWFSRSLW